MTSATSKDCIPTRRQAAKAATRAKILAAATCLFDRVGYDGVTIRDIAVEARMSTGALFNSWAGKDELFAEVFAADHARRRIAEGVCTALHGPHAWETATRAHRDLCLQAADRALESRALLQKAA